MNRAKNITQIGPAKTGNMNVFIYGAAYGGSRMVGSKKKRKVTGKKK